jgi:hypothetical protein
MFLIWEAKLICNNSKKAKQSQEFYAFSNLREIVKINERLYHKVKMKNFKIVQY